MSSSLIEKDDLKIVQTRPFKLIFCIGPLGSGRKSQVEKITNEFHYSKIFLLEKIKQEIESNTKLGLLAKEFLDKNQPISTEVTVAILVRGIIECKYRNIMIVDFPSNLEQAQYFEQNIMPISLILKFNSKEKQCLTHLNEELGLNISAEDYSVKYKDAMKDIEEVYNFYKPYSVIREIDADKSVTEVNTLTKQNMYPIIYTIIGKRYSGKTELSKMLRDKTGITLLDFGEFLNEPEIRKRKKENDFVVAQLILKLRKMLDTRVLIEDFPQNKEQYSYFINNCKPFEKIYYLDANNSSCLERVNRIPVSDPNYTDCSTLDKMLYEFEQKKPFIEFLKKKTKVQDINVNCHKVLTIERMMKQIQPYVVYFQNDIKEEDKNNLTKKLKEEYGFSEINLDEILQNGVKRKLVSGNTEINELDQSIKLIRPLLFREGCDKVILNAFPNKMESLNKFESSLCEISKYILLTDSEKLSTIKDENSMAVYFYSKNKLITLNPSENLTDYKIKETLDMTRDINIVFGMPGTGKTTMAKHLKEKYGFEILDFKQIIEKVKKTKIDPENPDAEPEVTFPDLTKFFKTYLEKEPLDKRIIVDNFFIPNAPEPYLIDTYEKALEIIKIIGNFRNLYEIDLEEKTLYNKYKAKEGITEELTEDQKASFNETLEKPKKLLEDIRQMSANVIKVKFDEPEIKAKQIFDSQYGVNFIMVKHEYDICLEKTLKLFCARNKILYINVPLLIYKHFYENDEEAKKLESVYGKKKLKVNCENPDNFDEMVYYKYNPIYFEKDLVNQLILQHTGKYYKNIEGAGNFVLLTGYYNVDLLAENEGPFNLPLYEIKSSIELGEITAFIQLTRKEIKQIEDEKPEEIIIEKPKKEVKKNEDGEEEEPQEEEPQEEENPDGPPKFKPENFTWTTYDGNPRNYVQVLKRLKMYPVTVVNAGKTCRDELVKAIRMHLHNFRKRNENEYLGTITIININSNVEEEINESVNKLVEIDLPFPEEPKLDEKK